MKGHPVSVIEFLLVQVIPAIRKQSIFTERWLADGTTSVTGYCNHIYRKFWGDSSRSRSPYVDNIFVTWNNDNELLEKFLGLRPTVTFKIERQNKNCLPFLYVLVTRDHGSIETSIYRKLICTGNYLNRVSVQTRRDGESVPPSCHHLQQIRNWNKSLTYKGT